MLRAVEVATVPEPAKAGAATVEAVVSDRDHWADGDECACGHLREDHDDGTGSCGASASSGYRCSCPEFELA